jgi:hypothetical protein
MLEIGQEVYMYKIKLDFKDDTVSKVNEKNKIIGLNKSMFCLDDYNFTKVDLNKESYNINPLLDRPNCYHFKGTFYDEITGTLFTTKKDDKKQYLKVKKALGKYIQDKFGKYSGSNLLDKLEI